MPTCTVVLDEHQAEFIERAVSSGRYHDTGEVLREGLRLVERRDKEADVRLQVLRSAVQVGIDDIETGRSTVLKSDEDIHRHLASMYRGCSTTPWTLGVISSRIPATTEAHRTSIDERS